MTIDDRVKKLQFQSHKGKVLTSLYWLSWIVVETLQSHKGKEEKTTERRTQNEREAAIPYR